MGFLVLFFFLLFRQIFGFLYILGYLGLKGFHISSEKKKKQLVKGSAGAH